MAAITYPRLIKRVRAVLIDGTFTILVIFLSIWIGSQMGVSTVTGKALLIVLPILILDPMLVTFTGGTIGHHLMGIRVTRMDGLTRINIVAAIVRFIVKTLLGWFSFIFVLTSSRYQAVHDMVVHSIVVHKDPQGLPGYEVLTERPPKNDPYLYPSAWRRFLLIAAYWVLYTLIISICSAIFITPTCLDHQHCGAPEDITSFILSLAWLLGIGWMSVAGVGDYMVAEENCLRHPSMNENFILCDLSGF